MVSSLGCGQQHGGDEQGETGQNDGGEECDGTPASGRHAVLSRHYGLVVVALLPAPPAEGGVILVSAEADARE